MALSQIKKGHGGNLTPWDFLREDMRGPFREYALAMKGRKQLHFSRGLRDLLGLNAELTDDQVAEMEDPLEYLLTVLSPENWGRVLKMGWRLKLLETAEKEGLEGIQRLLLEAVPKLEDCPF
jgi:hypothetical protein